MINEQVDTLLRRESSHSMRAFPSQRDVHVLIAVFVKLQLLRCNNFNFQICFNIFFLILKNYISKIIFTISYYVRTYYLISICASHMPLISYVHFRKCGRVSKVQFALPLLSCHKFIITVRVIISN